MKNIPDQLKVSGGLASDGMVIKVNEDSFKITYDQAIWEAYPLSDQERLLDNIAYSSTLFLPQILNKPSIEYSTARPLSEAFLFKNGIYDMPNSAQTDGKSSVDYLKKFFNTQYLFEDNNIKTPSSIDFKVVDKEGKRTAIIPFSSGKESLLSFALCMELGIEPILVSIVEPVNEFEYYHKKKLLDDFEKMTGVKVYTIHYEPSLMRYGAHWGLKTELGWGLHTTEYQMLCLPFIKYFEADYIVMGNEHSCNDSFVDKEGLLTYEYAYDQHQDWTHQQSLLATLLGGDKVSVISLMQPLHEISITHILHNRYPQYGAYQMSCVADRPEAAHIRWCQQCNKCVSSYLFCSAAGIDPLKIGFSENLFDAPLYDYFFNNGASADGELALSFYLAKKNGFKGKNIDRFKNELLPLFEKEKNGYVEDFMGFHSSFNIPDELLPEIKNIFESELKAFKMKL